MANENYVIGLNATSLDSLNGKLNEEAWYKFYRSFEGWYLTNCDPEKGQFHLPEKIEPNKLKDKFFFFFPGRILSSAIGDENAVNIELKVSDGKKINGRLIREGKIFPAYNLKLANQK